LGKGKEVKMMEKEYEVILRQWNHPEVGDSWEYEKGLPASWVRWERYQRPCADRAGQFSGRGEISFPEKTFKVRVVGSLTIPGGYFGRWEVIPETDDAGEEREFYNLLSKYVVII
jgi:hypothetical protein